MTRYSTFLTLKRILGTAFVLILGVGLPGPAAPGWFAHEDSADGHAATADAAGGPSQSGAGANIDVAALGDRLIATQHRDDEALDTYERIEHHTTLAGGDRHVTEERVYRVVPTGTGTLKLLLREGRTPVDANTYGKELHDWEQVLEIAMNPADSREQAAAAKQQRKLKDRATLVDAARRAFRASLAGQERRDGRLIDIVQLDPNPEFQPHSLAENVFPHARAKLWVDDSSGQMIRAEADIVSDVWIGAGILGKLYKGSHFTLENSEVSPGLWLPSRIQYDFSGRKFFFVFEQHEVTEFSRYRVVGSPKDALAMVRDEIARGGALPAEP
jgi:hypothetical protein